MYNIKLTRTVLSFIPCKCNSLRQILRIWVITYSIVLHTELVSQCILVLRRMKEMDVAQQRPESTNSTTLITISGTHRIRVVPWEERKRGDCFLCDMIARFDEEWSLCDSNNFSRCANNQLAWGQPISSEQKRRASFHSDEKYALETRGALFSWRRAAVRAHTICFHPTFSKRRQEEKEKKGKWNKMGEISLF